MPAAAGTALRHETPGNDLKGNSRGSERQDLLAASSEDEWVSPLQSDDEARSPVQDEQFIDHVLTQPLTGDAKRGLRSLLHELSRHEPVVEDDITRTQEFQAPDGDQARITGPSADEIDGQVCAPRCRLALRELRETLLGPH